MPFAFRVRPASSALFVTLRLISRAYVNTTSFAVSGVPSEKTTSLRRLKVIDLLSSEIFHEVARDGSTFW